MRFEDYLVFTVLILTGIFYFLGILWLHARYNEDVFYNTPDYTTEADPEESSIELDKQPKT